MMVEYLPWSTKVLNDCIKLNRAGYIPTLDIELTSQCSGANCIYCDSKPSVCSYKNKDEFNFSLMKQIILDAKKHRLQWIYTCGLGEPLEDDRFWNMVYLLKSNNIKLSMFSNGIFIKDRYIAKELKDNDVNIILKMDTFDENKFDVILGGKGIAQHIYAARDYLLDVGYAQQYKYTNLAFSIVPTSLSINGIPDVVEYAKKHGIFASIGELEQAGEVLNNDLTNTLSISKQQVESLKRIADVYAEGHYMRPICPCIFTGLHIDNVGDCIVDKITGLNCKWFLLKNPDTIKLGNIKEDNIIQLIKKVNNYRQNCFRNNKSTINETCAVSYTFGGCGGNPKEIISLVEKSYE